MSLFKRKPKSWSLTVPNTESFKGYKRIKLTTYGDKDAEAGINKVIRSGAPQYIRFEEVPTKNGIVVFADGCKVGLIWQNYWSDQYKAIKDGRVDAVHLRIESDVHLFLHII